MPKDELELMPAPAKGGAVSVAEKSSDLPATGLAGFITAIERAARDPSVDVVKMRELFALVKEVRAMENEEAFGRAMASAQLKMPPVVRKGKNTFMGTSYARFEHVNEICKPIYAEAGLSLIFGEGDAPAGSGKIRTTCQITHGGHSVTKHIDLSPDDTGAQGKASKTKIQGEGSTFSYARRYLMCLIFNISLLNEDDDGNQGRVKIPRAGDDSQVKILAGQLWALMKPVRGTESNWNKANQWLWQHEILDGATTDTAPHLSVEKLTKVIAAVRNHPAINAP